MKRPRLLDKQYGKEVYDRGNFSEGFYNYYEAFGLCQFLIWELGYGYQKCKTYLTEFSKRCDPNFNEVKSLDRINVVIKRAEKKKPDSFVDVTITDVELSKIGQVKNFKYQKFLFSLLVYAKRYKFDTTNQKKKKDNLGYHISQQIAHNITVDMNMKISLANMGLFLQKFYLLGLVDGSSFEMINILYSDDSGKPVVEVLGTEPPWISYVKLFDGEQIYCENCQKQEKRKFSNQKYCENCRKIMQKEKTKMRTRLYRK